MEDCIGVSTPGRSCTKGTLSTRGLCISSQTIVEDVREMLQGAVFTPISSTHNSLRGDSVYKNYFGRRFVDTTTHFRVT